jgi:hypothetical protein
MNMTTVAADRAQAPAPADLAAVKTRQQDGDETMVAPSDYLEIVITRH